MKQSSKTAATITRNQCKRAPNLYTKTAAYAALKLARRNPCQCQSSDYSSNSHFSRSYAAAVEKFSLAAVEQAVVPCLLKPCEIHHCSRGHPRRKRTIICRGSSGEKIHGRGNLSSTLAPSQSIPRAPLEQRAKEDDLRHAGVLESISIPSVVSHYSRYC